MRAEEGRAAMSGHRSFDLLRAPTPERQERVATYERSIRTALRLRDLRTRFEITQAQLAKRMAVSQEFVSKLERGADPRLSSITRYVQAMGGEVKLVVTMPNQAPIDLAMLPTEGMETSPRRRRQESRATPV